MKAIMSSDKFRGFVIFAAILSGFGLLAYTPTSSLSEIPIDGEGAESAVLVELFTSEGCHSCPPAEQLVNQMIEQDVVLGADVIALQFHVDYWNHLGWEDPYSDEKHSKRQREYAKAFRNSSIYTPQMVVDGQTEFVGSSAGKALDAIDLAKRKDKVDLTVTKVIEGDELSLTISSDEVISSIKRYDVFVAITENHIVQKVPSGENGGKTLSHHGVVRRFHNVGQVFPNQKVVFEADIKLPKEVMKENLSVVVFLQDSKSKHIAGVSQVTLSN